MKNSLISDQDNILEALKKINKCSSQISAVVFVINKERQVVGTISDGDIRRYLIDGGTLKDSVCNVMHRDFVYIDNVQDYKQIKNARASRAMLVPILDKKKKFMDLLNFKELRSLLPVDAVIMAGGEGRRLKPYTDKIPKPMLELAGEPIIAHNIDRLLKYGIKDLNISVNHQKEVIKDYINEHETYKNLNISFIEEKKPLGTVGAIGLVQDFINDTILVMNSDILTNIDFADLYESHKGHNADMTVATFSVKVDIPYAVLNTKKDRITSFVEKPTYNYYSNAGIYLINKEVLDVIPYNQRYDATDLMSQLIENGSVVNHFPIRGYWLDIGTPQNYSKAQEDITFIKF